MAETSFRSLGSPLRRLVIGFLFLALCSLNENPLVRLEAKLGLSPSPIERLLGMKSLFSGMTEGVVQFMNLDLKASVQANIFAPLVVPVFLTILVVGKVPRIHSRTNEIAFLVLFALMSTVVNLV